MKKLLMLWSLAFLGLSLGAWALPKAEETGQLPTNPKVEQITFCAAGAPLTKNPSQSSASLTDITGVTASGCAWCLGDWCYNGYCCEYRDTDCNGECEVIHTACWEE